MVRANSKLLLRLKQVFENKIKIWKSWFLKFINPPRKTVSNNFKTCESYKTRFWNLVFATKSNILEPEGVHLWDFKLRLFNITEFIVWNI